MGKQVIGKECEVTTEIMSMEEARVEHTGV